MPGRTLQIMYGVGGGAELGRGVDGWRTVQLHHPERSTYVIGQPGMGKSTLLLNLILSDIEKADKGLVVLDPHGDLARDVISRCPQEHAERVIYFAPVEQTETPFGLNPFEWHDAPELGQKFGAINKVFKHLWYGDFRRTPLLQSTLATLVGTLLAAYEQYQTHFLHMQLVLQEGVIGDKWRERLSACVRDNPAMWADWVKWQDARVREGKTQSSENKISTILKNDVIRRILCQPTSSECFRFQETLGAKKILVVNLDGLDEDGQKLIGSVILTQLLVMAYLRKADEQRVPCHIYADEFHRFAPEAFVELITQARKYRVFCTIAHQTRAQLRGREARAAARSCGNKVVFKVEPTDARRLSSGFIKEEGSFPEHGLSELPFYQAMVRVEDKASRVTRQARVETFRESGTVDESVATSIRQRSRETYGRPLAEVQAATGDLTLHERQPVPVGEEPAQQPIDTEPVDDQVWWEPPPGEGE